MASERMILGIETSCDETAAAVVQGGRVVRANVVASQAELHAPYGGVFPEVASRQHVRDIHPVIDQAVREAEIELSDVTAVAVTRGPGLSGSLLVGLNAAKGLAMSAGLPLIGVNHLQGHIASQWLHHQGRIIDTAVADQGLPPAPPLPQIALVVSGGHTDLAWVDRPRATDDAATGSRVQCEPRVRSEGGASVLRNAGWDGPLSIRRLGGTVDDAAGEAFDKAARMLDLGYPGGPAIQKAARDGDPEAFDLPVARTEDPLDFSFSGVKTALLRTIQRMDSDDLPVADLAASFQHAVVSALIDRLGGALDAHRGARAICVSGGVSANAALREALVTLGTERELPIWLPPMSLCTDNAAMIAAAGDRAFVGGVRSGWSLDSSSSLPIDAR